MIKFGFKNKTRSGTIVENLMFSAHDRVDAERKVTQIYQRCEILECHEIQQSIKEGVFDFERLINLISTQSDAGSPATDQLKNSTASNSSSKAV